MTFQIDNLVDAINDELNTIADEAILRGEVSKAGWEPEIDSHSVLRVSLRIEEETGLEISEDCVPVGGFKDRATCIAVMMQHTEKAWAEKQKTKTKVSQ